MRHERETVVARLGPGGVRHHDVVTQASTLDVIKRQVRLVEGRRADVREVRPIPDVRVLQGDVVRTFLGQRRSRSRERVIVVGTVRGTDEGERFANLEELRGEVRAVLNVMEREGLPDGKAVGNEEHPARVHHRVQARGKTAPQHVKARAVIDDERRVRNTRAVDGRDRVRARDRKRAVRRERLGIYGSPLQREITVDRCIPNLEQRTAQKVDGRHRRQIARNGQFSVRVDRKVAVRLKEIGRNGAFPRNPRRPVHRHGSGRQSAVAQIERIRIQGGVRRKGAVHQSGRSFDRNGLGTRKRIFAGKGRVAANGELVTVRGEVRIGELKSRKLPEGAFLHFDDVRIRRVENARRPERRFAVELERHVLDGRRARVVVREVQMFELVGFARQKELRQRQNIGVTVRALARIRDGALAREVRAELLFAVDRELERVPVKELHFREDGRRVDGRAVVLDAVGITFPNLVADRNQAVSSVAEHVAAARDLLTVLNEKLLEKSRVGVIAGDGNIVTGLDGKVGTGLNGQALRVIDRLTEALRLLEEGERIFVVEIELDGRFVRTAELTEFEFVHSARRVNRKRAVVRLCRLLDVRIAESKTRI